MMGEMARPRMRLPLVAALLATGFVSIVGQLVLLRELNVAFFGVELVYLLGLGAWLLFSGGGALLGPRRRPPTPAVLAGLFVLFAFVLLAELAFLRGARSLLGVAPGAFLPFGTGMLALSAAILPPALIAGLLFTVVARVAVDERRSFATAYAVESLGGLLGGLAATLALARGTNAVALALVAGLAALAVATLWQRGALARLILGALIAGDVLALAQSAALDLALTRTNHPAVVESRDSPYARYTVTRRAGQVNFFVNDALAFESQGVDAEAFVDPVLLAHPQPQRVAVLGVGAGDLVREVLRHAPAVVDAVELDEIALDLARRYVPGESLAALDDPRVRLVVDDPRRFLTRASTYDVILIGVADPDSGQTNRFYTQEFFLECARHLTPEGVLGLRLRGAENLWTPQLARRMSAIDGALRAAFRDVLFLPGSVSVVLASPAPLPRDGRLLGARFGARRLSARLVSPPYLNYLMTNDRVAATAALLARTPAILNSDARPICYAQAAALWLTRFYPSLGFAGRGALRDTGLAVTLVLGGTFLILVVAVLLRRRAPARRVSVAFVAGLNGMVVEGVLILHYQAQRGALFQDLGALLTAFMAGLTLGARVMDVGPGARGGRQWGRTILLGTVGLDLLAAFVVQTGMLAGLIGTGLLLVVTGVAVGGAVACIGRRDAARVVGPLYAADLVGGCVGAVLGSLLLVPLLGLTFTALAAAVLVISALALA
jgi:spermidine synthase